MGFDNEDELIVMAAMLDHSSLLQYRVITNSTFLKTYYNSGLCENINSQEML